MASWDDSKEQYRVHPPIKIDRSRTKRAQVVASRTLRQIRKLKGNR